MEKQTPNNPPPAGTFAPCEGSSWNGWGWERCGIDTRYRDDNGRPRCGAH